MRRKKNLINLKASALNSGIAWIDEDEANFNAPIYPETEVKRFLIAVQSLILRPLPRTSGRFSTAVDSLYQRFNAFKTEADHLQREIETSSLIQSKKRLLSKALQNATDEYTIHFKYKSESIITKALEKFGDEFEVYQRSDNAVSYQSGPEIFMSHFALDQLKAVVYKEHYPYIKEKISSHEFYSPDEEEIDLSFPEEYKSVNDMFTEVKNTYVDYVFNEFEKTIQDIKLIDRIPALAATTKLEVYQIVADIYDDVSSINKAAEFFKNEIDAMVFKKIDSLTAEYHRAKEDIFINYLSHLGNLNNVSEVVEWVVKAKQSAFETVCRFFHDPQKINAELKIIRDLIDKHALEKIKTIELNKKMQLERPRRYSFLLDFDNGATEGNGNLAKEQTTSNATARERSVPIPEAVASFINGPRFASFRKQKVEAIKSREERSHFLKFKHKG